ncbi:hypothetical protein [Acidihalobacter prosperus]|uniref:hypothetical protein n=1 Tax=Acidihalobacter prosperus TaxID=160660 RepID=UPI0011AB6CFA|nr:hypothetical protein [Acidihalobacter prosperus]
MNKAEKARITAEAMAGVQDLFASIDQPREAPPATTVPKTIPPGAVRDLVEAELSRPAPRGGYFRGLAAVEIDKKIRAELMRLAAEYR